MSEKSAKKGPSRRDARAMSTVGDLKRELDKSFVHVEGERRASVAVLLRLGSKSCEIPENSDWELAKVRDLEVFFILRAANDGDRWGGQVGLPGGRQETGESDAQTAAREVLEEVGIRLPGLPPKMALEYDSEEDGAFELVGRVNDRKILRGPDGLVVCAFVYFQKTADTPHLILDEEEVAACGWFPVSELMKDDCGEALVFDLGLGTLPKESPLAYSVARWLSLDRMLFTKVDLGKQLEPLFVAYNTETGSNVVLPTSLAPIDLENDAQIRRSFFLWGLTLGILNDMLHLQGGIRPSRISIYEKIPLLGMRVERVYDSKVHNILVSLMRNTYETVYGEPMPWNMYVKIYPLSVLMGTGLVSSAALRKGAQLLKSKL